MNKFVDHSYCLIDSMVFKMIMTINNLIDFSSLFISWASRFTSTTVLRSFLLWRFVLFHSLLNVKTETIWWSIWICDFIFWGFVVFKFKNFAWRKRLEFLCWRVWFLEFLRTWEETSYLLNRNFFLSLLFFIFWRVVDDNAWWLLFFLLLFLFVRWDFNVKLLVIL